MARQGKAAKALPILEKLHKAHPADARLTYDLIAVAGWAGHDARAIRLYNSLPAGALPDYVLASVGGSYRRLGQPENALAVYRRGHKQSPGNKVFIDGIARSEADIHKAGLKPRGFEGSALAASGPNIYDSLASAERAHDRNPGNPQAVRELIRAEVRVGAPQVALELADKHPGVISDKERRQIEGDVAASLVRWGVLEPASESGRYAETDNAIAVLDKHIAQWSQAGPEAAPEVLRARFDRIAALRDRSRMKDVLAEYKQLQNEGVDPPAYVLSAVGDAYLYFREPAKARDLYLQALKKNPEDYDTRRQLYFAYVETDDFSDAYKTIDTLRAEQPEWLYLKGEPDRLENPRRDMADIDANAARFYGEQLIDADQQLSALVDAAPNDPRKRYALGSLYLTRSEPRLAYAQFDIGERIQENNQEIRNPDNASGLALAALDMRNYPEADSRLKELTQNYPENLDVQRAEHLWEVENRPEIIENGYYNFRPSNSAQGGAGYGTDTQLFSAPINYNWRVFGDFDFMHEVEPNDEGKIDYWQSALGLEYRDPSLLASFAPTFNRYHNSERVGFNADADWTFNDHWSAGGGWELFSKDIPLRALNSGVTADKYSANVEWHRGETTEARLEEEIMPFSDGNFRTGTTLTLAQRLYSTPHFKFDAVADLESTQDTKDDNRNYFNPSLDFTGLAGLRATEVLYRSYENVYEHSLSVMPGNYWEQYYGRSQAWNVSYEQTLHTNDAFEGKFGVTYLRQDYDGVPENNVSLMLNLVGRF